MAFYEENELEEGFNRGRQDNSENTPDDGYDYLDSLMQDMMETEDDTDEPSYLESTNGKQVDIDDEDNNDKTGGQTPAEDSSESEIEDSSEDEIEDGSESYLEEDSESQKKRVPLFQQIGIEKESNVGKESLNEGNYNKQESNDNRESNDNKISSVGKKGLFNKINTENEELKEEETVEKNVDESIIEKIYNKNEEIIVEETHDENKKVSEEVDTPTDDNFDNMLDDLTNIEEEIEEDDLEDNQENLDKDVKIPLQKPGMEEIKVTADGRTLAEMIPGLRGGNKTTNEIFKNIKEQAGVVEANEKKFSDSRYLKHAKPIEDKRAAQDERRAFSNKFLQKNAKFTEQEKIIMENLGITNEQFTNLMGSKKLNKKEKERILALGKYGTEKYFKGRRYRTTVGDTAMLEFLAKFKFANTRILRWISNEPQGRTWRKLNRLRNNGLTESKSLIGVPDLWAATPAGIAIAGYNFKPGLRPMPKMMTVSSTMGVNYIAACLWFNTVNVLNLDDFPANNRIISVQEDGRDRARGEMLISELEIRSSLGREITPTSSTMQRLGDERLYDVISANVRDEFEKWEEGGKLGESPEFALGNEFMWILYPTSQLTLSYHVPDLVVKRERGPKGEPRSIAVELERHEKDSSRYDKTMLAYKLDEYLYEQVVWITPNTRVARALERSAKNVGFTRYTIVPIITETGVYNKQDIWMI